VNRGILVPGIVCILGVLICGIAVAKTFTLRPYVISVSNHIALQDIFEEPFSNNLLLDEGRSWYTAAEVGALLRRLGYTDFVIVGERVDLFRGVKLFTPETWYKHIREAYPDLTIEEMDLPEVFEVVSEVMQPQSIEVTTRIYQPRQWEVRHFSLPVGASRLSLQGSAHYRLERIGEKDGFLTYLGRGVSIRIPVRLVSSPKEDQVVLQNRINHRLLRLKTNDIEGL